MPKVYVIDPQQVDGADRRERKVRNRLNVEVERNDDAGVAINESIKRACQDAPPCYIRAEDWERIFGGEE